MEHKFLIDFVLLHEYSLENFGLANGKLGVSLCLFEYSRKYKDDLIEKHAFNLLEEVLASSMQSCTFYNGKIGVSWALSYLLRNEYIDIDYLELYGKEHKEIVTLIKRIKDSCFNIAFYVDAMIFLMTAKKYISFCDYKNIFMVLSDGFEKYFSTLPKTPFECELFYNLSSKVLACYNLYKEDMLQCNFVDSIYLSSVRLTNEGYVCKNLLFGSNLLQYSLYNHCTDWKPYAVDIIKSYIENFHTKAANLQEAIDVVYIINKLQRFKWANERFLALKEQVYSLLQDEKSFFYITDTSQLITLKEGIPKLLFMKCLISKKDDFEGHLIME